MPPLECTTKRTMELCSGDGPTRRENMCKKTKDPVHLPSVVRPIEKWYVVARKKNTGTCSIYSSWADYQSETKHPQKNPLLSAPSAEKTKNDSVDAEKYELAAFPTMTQAITYLNVIGRRSPESVKSSAFIPSVSSDSRYGSMIAGGQIIPSLLPPKVSKSQLLQGTAGANNGVGSTPPSVSVPTNQNRLVSNLLKRTHNSTSKTIEIVDEDSSSHSESSNDVRTATHAKSQQSPSPIFSTPFKKRKVEIQAKQANGSIIFSKGLTMSKTSETIDIGAPKRSNPDMSSLDALAIAASASHGKKKDKFKSSHVSKASGTESETERRNVGETEMKAVASSTTPNGNRDNEGVRLSSSGIIQRGVMHSTIPSDILRRAENRSPAIGASNNFAQQIIQKQKEQARQRSSLVIPSVPGNLTSSLKIPEVPRGFIPAEQSHDRMWRPGMDLTGKKLHPNISAAALQSSNPNFNSVPSRLSIDSYYSKHFPHQMQQLPLHLQGIPPQAPTYGIPPHLLPSHLQPLQSRLNHHHLLGSSAYAQHVLRTIETASNASGTSEGDHSEITIKRHNGHPQVVSSPIGQRPSKSPFSLDTIYTTRKSDSPAPAK